MARMVLTICRLEKVVHSCNINFYEHSSFYDIECIGRGSFATVLSARFNETMFALKCHDISKASKECANELKQLCAIKFHPNIIQFYGITQA
ncbi:33613_t:CDS:2 [Gigaspora margarita]|uniref:33613_t:CDS:1 n=1 Tax=Gigaspora margarita TaxID=4874 RepID=A0ABM8W4W4_GIGMA|nr:33613_t:CDS:2 [Gigaspora margarita]